MYGVTGAYFDLYKGLIRVYVGCGSTFYVSTSSYVVSTLLKSHLAYGLSRVQVYEPI